MNDSTQQCPKCSAVFRASDRACPSCNFGGPPSNALKTDQRQVGIQPTSLSGRIGAVVAGLLSLALPAFVFWGFFITTDFFNGHTASHEFGKSGSAVAFLVVLGMAKEAWPFGLKALGAAFQKNHPSIHKCT
jgi:hypothetical protein